MALPNRFRLLLLDPVKLRRSRAEQVLRLRFDIESCDRLEEAMQAATARPPHAVVATLRQIEDNGLVAGKTLRTRLGPDAFIVVHGAADTRKSSADRQILAERHGVDVWSESALEPEGIESVVWGELFRRNRPKVPPPPTLLERARATTAEDVKTFLNKDRPLLPTPYRAPDEEPGWIELLNAPPTSENLKRLLTKEIGGPRKARE
jgi:response regulator RpfG family c-di-GMP phosphodiesterase